MRQIKQRAKNLIDYLPWIVIALIFAGNVYAYYNLLVYRFG